MNQNIKSIHLEVGKTYVTEIGLRARITRYSRANSLFFGQIEESSDGIDLGGERTWYPDGHRRPYDGRPELRIVSKYIPPVDDTAGVTKLAVPHAELIRAVLDGKTIQQMGSVTWGADLTGVYAIKMLLAHPECRARVKPEPVERWCPLGANGNVFAHSLDRETAVKRCKEMFLPHVLHLALDPDTSDVISAKTEAP